MSTTVSLDIAELNTLNVVCKKANTFTLILKLTETIDGVTSAFNLTGYTGRAEVKARNEDDPVILAFDSSDTGPTTMEMAGGTDNNEIKLIQTQSAMDLTVGEYVWDVRIRIDSPSEDRRHVSEGSFKINSRITKTAPAP